MKFTPLFSNNIHTSIPKIPYNLQKDYFNVYPAQEEKLQFLGLNDVIIYGIKNHLELKQNWENTKIAKAEYKEGLSKYWPKLEIASSWNKSRLLERINGIGQITHEHSMNIKVNLSYTLFSFQKTYFESAALKAKMIGENERYRESLSIVIGNVIAAYHDYFYHQEIVDALQEEQFYLKTLVEETKKKEYEGLSNTIDIASTKRAYLKNQLSLIQARTDLQNTYIALLVEMGIDPTKTVEFIPYQEDEPENLIKISNNALNVLTKSGKSTRGVLLSAKADLMAAKASCRAKKRQYFPQFTTTLSVGPSYPKNGVQKNYEIEGLIQVKMPLFQGFEIKEQVQQAKAYVAQTMANFTATQQTICQEILVAQHQFLAAKEGLEAAKEYTSWARQEFDAKLKGYTLGIYALSDVLESQSNLFDSKKEEANFQKKYRISISELMRALGDQYVEYSTIQSNN